MTATAERTVITDPGVYDLTEAEYHGDPVEGRSLSSTGARKLLPPSCPAIFAWEREHPAAPSKAFDVGHAAHDAVLGKGPEIVRVDHDLWNTAAAKAEVAAVRDRGAVPLKPAEYQQVQDMAAALRAHPFAGKLFAPGSGTPEASLFARDEPTGVMLRGRLDWLPRGNPKRLIVPDYKTAKSAEPDEFMKSAANYGYHQQGAWYADLITALGLAEHVVFVFVVQEKTAPYVVSVVQLDFAALSLGRALNRRAIDTYAECTRTGHWPGYVEDVAIGSLPYWYEKKFEDLT